MEARVQSGAAASYSGAPTRVNAGAHGTASFRCNRGRRGGGAALTDYKPQLDSLRAFAVTAVLSSHFLGLDLPFGHLGVRLFFVLSGFLITGILLREGVTVSFFVRRAARLWPLLYLILAISLAGNLDGIRETAWWRLTQATNLLLFHRHSWDGAWSSAHLWTLNVEEQFYLVWPFVIGLTPRKWLPVVLSLIAATGPAYRYFVGYDEFAALLPPASLDALAAGGLLALAPSRAVYGLAAVAFPVCVLSLVAGEMELLEIASVAVFCGLILAGSRGELKLIEHRWLIGLGKISYGVYLLHPYVWSVVGKLGGPKEAGWPALLVMSSLTIPAAVISFRWFEQPLRDRSAALLTLPAGAPNPTRLTDET